MGLYTVLFNFLKIVVNFEENLMISLATNSTLAASFLCHHVKNKRPPPAPPQHH